MSITNHVQVSYNSDLCGVGCGVNVTNKDPTVCINDLLHQLNDLDSRSKPDPFTVEEVIARSVSVLEELIDKFETEDRHWILEQYYTHWLHRQLTVISFIGSVTSTVAVPVLLSRPF